MSDGKIDIALVQFRRDRFDKEANRGRMLELLAGVSGADIVCLPEVWMGALALDDEEMERLLEELGEMARGGGYTLLTGGLFVRRGGTVVDVCHVLGPDGAAAGEQLKLFPSGAVGEREYCTGGGRLEVFDAAGARFGVAVCVDVLYPEVVRALAMKGAQVVFNPANIPEERNPLWHSIVRTRAAENTVYTAYANNTGTEYADGRDVSGGSMTAGPDGSVLIAGGKEEEVVRAEIDPALIEEQRKRWRYLEDVRGYDFGGL